MAKIHTLKIINFRGIKKFEQVFGKSNFICLIGRGDSGKTTILQAISAVLSPKWNYTFYDTDFFNGNIEESIMIEASLYDIPSELLSDTKYGLRKRLLNSQNDIIDDLTQEDSPENIDILTIRLEVKKNLEPKWYIFNERDNQDLIEIKSSDRAKLNAFLVSDYLDRHFSWSKGNPLYSMLNKEDNLDEREDVIIEALREAKKTIDRSSFKHLDNVVEKLKSTVENFGIDISDIYTTIDFKDIFATEAKVCLHEDNIPFRQKGKGSKRILSIAIQTELAKTSGILLIDEIEQGLEPDRARFLANILKRQNQGQVFLTTHSNNVIVELDAKDLYLKRKDEESLFTFDEQFKGCLRSNAEAFFAKRVLICEGATEVGICRELNNYRISKGKANLALLGICVVDGRGTNLIDYSQKFRLAGYDVCVLCDSDDEIINRQKSELTRLLIEFIDCEKGNSIEFQLFQDLPWIAIKDIIKYAIEIKSEESISMLVKNQYLGELPTDWKEKDTKDIRDALSKASTYKKKKKDGSFEDKAWFKMIHHGEFLGQVWFKNISNLPEKHLSKQFNSLNNWMDNV